MITKDRCRYFYGECHVVTDENGKILAMFADPKDAKRYSNSKRSYKKVREVKIDASIHRTTSPNTGSGADGLVDSGIAG